MYAPQPGVSSDEKDRLYEQLLLLVTSATPSETFVITGDFNGQVSQHRKVSVGIMVGLVMEHGIRKE